MKLFDPPSAAHFCTRFTNQAGPSAGNMRCFLDTLHSRVTILQEGNADFDAYRACVLREAERRLLLACTLYRRAHDLMIPSTSPWAHVTLYYSSFYSASSLVAMLGGWIDVSREVLVQVQMQNAGSQSIEIVRGRKKIEVHTADRNSHRGFWDVFYNSITSLAGWIPSPGVPSRLKAAIQPGGGTINWQIETRNRLNYQSHDAIEAMVLFRDSFSSTQFPNCLSGDLSIQYEVSSNMVELASTMAGQIGLATDALAKLSAETTKRRMLDELVMTAPIPKLPANPVRRRIRA